MVSKHPIILVGPMGSGKSAVGHRLASMLGCKFIDTDREIENRCGVDIAFIFEKEGEDGFRKRETEALQRAVIEQHVVIATGGGIVSQSVNLDILSRYGIVIYLETSVEQQYARTKHTTTRPLLANDDPQKKLKDLYAAREPLYQQVADITINTDGQRVPQVAKKIQHNLHTFEHRTHSLMHILTVDLGKRSYPIFIGQQSFEDLSLWQHVKQHVPLAKRLLIISDTNVAPLYLENIKHGLPEHHIEQYVVTAGEDHKKLVTVERMLDQLVKSGMTRDGAVIALGGGVIGDMAGFAAACYMRGIAFIQVPTTLLAQVDSSVGGKTGVNHKLGKNLIGAFYQPQAVIINTDTLLTLDQREVKAGIAEVIKYGCIFDRQFFGWLESNITSLLALDTDALAHAITLSCQTKAAIVAKDELEKGERALLNFGHSFGHALEQVTHYKKWLHGEAVAIGMLMASRLSVSMSLLDEHDEQRIRNLIDAAGLPTDAGTISVEEVVNAMQKDKKNTASDQRLVVLQKIGSSQVRADCPSDLIAQAITAYSQTQ